MGEEEIRDIIYRQQGAEVRCHFCNELYQFDKSELEAPLQGIKG